jgi:hypothetical protein
MGTSTIERKEQVKMVWPFLLSTGGVQTTFALSVELAKDM